MNANAHIRPLTRKDGQPIRVLITAGPTQEPIDRVRFIGNRSSGRLGIALAHEAIRRGLDTTLLLGPIPAISNDSEPPQTSIHTRLSTVRFQTTAELQTLLKSHAPGADVIIMAAAVADYTPKTPDLTGKLRRGSGPLTLELVPTPDLLASIASARKPGQLFVGFALEPRDRLLDSAREKLTRKQIDLIVANELETMESGTIEARVLGKKGEDFSTQGKIEKTAFASWLLDIVTKSLQTTG